MQLKPLAHRVIIEALEEHKTTPSGIVLPDNTKEKPQRGKVVAVGPGKRNENGTIQEMSIQVGDVVLFKKYGPDEFEIEGKTYLIGDEDDILAVFG